VSKGIVVDKTVGYIGLAGQTVTEICFYWLQVNRHRDGRSFTQAFIWNRRGFAVDVQKKLCRNFMM
jgi:hypothetical protein